MTLLILRRNINRRAKMAEERAQLKQDKVLVKEMKL